MSIFNFFRKKTITELKITDINSKAIEISGLVNDVRNQLSGMSIIFVERINLRSILINTTFYLN
jgi:hypothetical protein